MNDTSTALTARRGTTTSGGSATSVDTRTTAASRAGASAKTGGIKPVHGNGSFRHRAESVSDAELFAALLEAYDELGAWLTSRAYGGWRVAKNMLATTCGSSRRLPHALTIHHRFGTFEKGLRLALAADGRPVECGALICRIKDRDLAKRARSATAR